MDSASLAGEIGNHLSGNDAALEADSEGVRRTLYADAFANRIRTIDRPELLLMYYAFLSNDRRSQPLEFFRGQEIARRLVGANSFEAYQHLTENEWNAFFKVVDPKQAQIWQLDADPGKLLAAGNWILQQTDNLNGKVPGQYGLLLSQVQTLVNLRRDAARLDEAKFRKVIFEQLSGEAPLLGEMLYDLHAKGGAHDPKIAAALKILDQALGMKPDDKTDVFLDNISAKGVFEVAFAEIERLRAEGKLTHENMYRALLNLGLQNQNTEKEILASLKALNDEVHRPPPPQPAVLDSIKRLEEHLQSLPAFELRCNEAEAGVQLASLLLGLSDKQAAHRISVIGQETIRVIRAVVAFQTYQLALATPNGIAAAAGAAALGPVGLAAVGVSALFNIASLFSSQPDVEQQRYESIISGLQQIQSTLLTVRDEMHARFDRIDDTLDQINSRLLDVYRAVQEGRADLDRSVQVLRRDIASAKSLQVSLGETVWRGQILQYTHSFYEARSLIRTHLQNQQYSPLETVWTAPQFRDLLGKIADHATGGDGFQERGGAMSDLVSGRDLPRSSLINTGAAKS